MPKRVLQPTQRRNIEKKENCTNRAVLNPKTLPHPMTYRPLGSKVKPKENGVDAASKAIPSQSEE